MPTATGITATKKAKDYISGLPETEASSVSEDASASVTNSASEAKTKKQNAPGAEENPVGLGSEAPSDLLVVTTQTQAKNIPKRSSTRISRARAGGLSTRVKGDHPLALVQCGWYEPQNQPFLVVVDPQAMLVMCVHAHQTCKEIIGLLGGTFDAEKQGKFVHFMSNLIIVPPSLDD